MLKKFDPSGPAPLINEGKSQGASAPKTVPNRVGSMKNRVLMDEASKSASKKSVFSAPRKGDDYNPMACGYTKVKG